MQVLPSSRFVGDQGAGLAWKGSGRAGLEQLTRERHPTLEITQGQVLNESPTDITQFWCYLYGN
jgi:hypothetical protein